MKNTIKTRRGLKMLRTLIVDDTLYTAPAFNAKTAPERHAMVQALEWINQLPLKKIKKDKACSPTTTSAPDSTN